MSGLDDLMADSDDRWAKAERYARGYADHGMGEALRIYYTRYFPLGVAVYAGVLILVGPLIFREKPTDWQLIAQGGVSSFALLAAVAGLVYNAKRLRPQVSLASDLAIVFPLDKQEQKYVKRVVNGKEPVPEDPAHLLVARSVAVQTRKNLATQLLIFPVYSYCLVYLLGDLYVFWVILTILFAVAVILLIREFRRTGHFLTSTAT